MKVKGEVPGITGGSILQLQCKGKNFDEIARGLNRIEAATLSGQPEWTAAEVRTLLPSLVDTNAQSLAHGDNF